MGQNTVDSVPNEAIAEENESEETQSEKHTSEGTLKSTSMPIHNQITVIR